MMGKGCEVKLNYSVEILFEDNMVENDKGSNCGSRTFV